MVRQSPQRAPSYGLLVIPLRRPSVYLTSLPLSDPREGNEEVQRSGGAAQTSTTWSSEQELSEAKTLQSIGTSSPLCSHSDMAST